jgi:arylsulfatase A-like enzyme/Flp pilus assembly protein TadD
MPGSRHALLFLAMAGLVLSACSPSRETVPAGTPVILISIDTLRSDHLPAYGYDGVETPSLDAFADDAVVFERVYSPYPLTLPAHASIFTGQLPPDHGVRNNKEGLLRENARTLAERLADGGYATAGFVSSAVLRRQTGIAQGYEHYDDDLAGGERPAAGRPAAERRGDVTTGAVRRWLESADTGRPLHLFVHLFDPHTPYAAPEPFGSRYAEPYDAEIAWTDRQVGALLDALKSRDLYDRSVIVVLSDHGEGLGDHVELEHGLFLYREALQVPLMVKLPGARRGGERIDLPAGLIDVAPTLLDLLGMETDGLSGYPLLGRRPAADRPLYAETSFPRYQYRWSDLRSVIVDTLHYIEAPRPELYDLVADPAETRNLLPGRPVPDAMTAALQEVGAGIESTAELTPEELAQLASLGYVGASSEDTGRGDDLPDGKDHIEAAEALWAHVRRAEADGSPEAVRAALAQMTALGLRSEAMFRNIALNLLHAGHPRAALEMLLPLEDSQQTATQVFLGSVKLELDDARGATASYRKALAISPTSSRAHYGLGAVYESSGDDRRATEHYRSAIDAEPGYLAAELRLGETLRRSGRFEAALPHYDTVLRADPRRAEARLGKALALARLSRWRETRAELEESMRVLPGQPAFAHALARVLVAAPEDSVRDAPRAMQLLQPLMQTDPSTDLAETVAMALAEAGRFDQATDWQQRAIEVARRAGRPDAASRMATNLTRYRQSRPCRVPWPDDHPIHDPARNAEPALPGAS